MNSLHRTDVFVGIYNNIFFWFQFKFRVNTSLSFIAYAFIVCVSALDIGACKLYFVKKSHVGSLPLHTCGFWLLIKIRSIS